VVFTACTQESSKYWLPDGLVTRGLLSAPLEEIEILTSAERVARSLSETIPVGVDQFLCTASKMAVAYSSPLTAWLEVPWADPVSEPSAASSAAADWAMVLARSKARRRSLEMVVSSSLGASFGRARRWDPR